MAIFHCNVRGVARSKSGAAVVDYIAREGKYIAVGKEFATVWSSNMPAFCDNNPREYFAQADIHERSNGRIGTKLVIALPHELALDQQKSLITDILAHALPSGLPYVAAIHFQPGNTHAHVLFSERIVTPASANLCPAAFFRRGGAKKSRDCHGCAWLRSVRQTVAERINQALALRGYTARVDHRTLAAQGITDRLPSAHRGPKNFERPSRLQMRAQRAWAETSWTQNKVQRELTLARVAAKKDQMLQSAEVDYGDYTRPGM